MSIAEKIKVLIVDDQVTSRLLLGDALQQLGFKQIFRKGRTIDFHQWLLIAGTVFVDEFC